MEHAAGRTTARLSTRTTMQASTSTKATSIRRRLAICRVEEEGEGLARNVGRASTGFSLLHLLTRSNWSEKFMLLRTTSAAEQSRALAFRRRPAPKDGARRNPTDTHHHQRHHRRHHRRPDGVSFSVPCAAAADTAASPRRAPVRTPRTKP